MGGFKKTDLNRVRRIAEYARYDVEAVEAVLDAGLVAHVGFVQDGQPFVIPMLYARQSDRLFLHGAKKSRIVKLLGSGAPVCVNVTLLDGLVVARSAFNSSMNYRSVVVFGTGQVIHDESLCLEALRALSEHAFPGRWQELRVPSDAEIAQTGVISLTIESASAKIADDPPDDDEADYATPVWAGVVPIKTKLQDPVGDERILPGVSLSDAISKLAGREF
jgi:nitroimidazol reductase NimA-like FMN-containing flavoprotein (pyridoxamine 5'-phosphate oxidase superfamily)